jgi:hypothetical protein
MNIRIEWTASEWFQRAAQAYVQGHQACVWCGGSHRVYRNERSGCVEYFCSDCEFYAIHDRNQNRYLSAPGQPSAAPVPLAD